MRDKTNRGIIVMGVDFALNQHDQSAVLTFEVKTIDSELHIKVLRSDVINPCRISSEIEDQIDKIASDVHRIYNKKPIVVRERDGNVQITSKTDKIFKSIIK